MIDDRVSRWNGRPVLSGDWDKHSPPPGRRHIHLSTAIAITIATTHSLTATTVARLDIFPSTRDLRKRPQLVEFSYPEANCD